MFGADISVTEINVSDLLAGAEFLTIPVLCFEFLLENLSLQNCLWTWSLANLYSLEGLDEICQEFAISRFHDCLIHLEDTYFCPPGHMISFLNKGLAMLCSRKDIKTFIDKYVQFDDSHKRFKKELQKCAIRSKESYLCFCTIYSKLMVICKRTINIVTKKKKKKKKKN